MTQQAGAIVVRRSGTAPPEVLLVRGTRQPFPWLFPKGHIDSGETPEQAAGRELREEAGVVGALIGRVGEGEFVDRDRRYMVAYYLFRPLSTNNPHEPRTQGWFTEEGALNHLSYDELKPLLVDAMRLFRSSETIDAR